MKVVQELVAYFDRRGKLSRKELRKLLEQNMVASDAPSSMHGLCEVVGTVYYFRVTGVAEGQLWGTDTYTRDSTIGAAAVHAGLLQVGESGYLKLTVVASLERYPGSTRNGVTSDEYASFPQAWTLEKV